MKKSIFLFFAAILCAMTANAKMVYLKPSSNWKEAGAIFYVWYWTGSSSGTAGKMQQLELGLYGYDIGNNTSFLITRNKSTAGDPWTDNWGQTGDLTYDANKPCYYVKNWNENGSGLIALPSAHIAGAEDLTGHNWSANASDNKMTKQNDGTWTLTKTIASINQGDYGYKVTDGSWDWSLGKNSNDDATINIPATGKYSVTFTYNPSANTVSAVATPVYSVKVNAGEGGTASGTGECVSGNSVNISAEALENYEFLNWTIESGTGSFGNTSEASTTFQPASNATIQANFRSTVTYSLTLQGGTGIASVTGNNDNVTLNQSYNISAEIVDGYSFAGWTADVAANADITDASLASTSVVVKNGSVVLTASATEITSTLTTANTYSEGTPDIAAPTASVSKVGVATIATITAASNAAYALTSWTLTNCERTDGGAENATEITVKGLGNNNEASVVANYTKIPTETVYLINTEAWETVMVYHWNPQGAAYPGAEMTKTGETIATFDVYEYTFAGSPDGLVFSCGADACKTGDLTWQAGKYYAPLKNEWYDTKEAAAEALAAPVEYEYVYLINTNDWAAAHIYTWTPEVASWPGAAMTLEAEQIAGKDVYSYKVVKGTTFGGLNFNCGGDGCKTGDLTWQAGKYYAPSTGEWYADAAAAEAALAAVVTYDYYIAGTLAGGWSATQQGMTKEDDVYKHTFFELNSGTYEFKITDGQFNSEGDNTHEHTILGAAYKEVSYNEGNIKIVTDEAINLTVIFDATEDEITFEGLTETTPAKCYLMGIGGDWTTGIEMEEDGDQFKLLCQPIAEGEQFKFKYGDTWTTDVENYDANGVGWVETSPGSGQYNITLPAGNYDFYYKKNENKVWIEAATDCAPATATITLVDAQEYGATLTLSADEYVVGDEITASAAIYDEGYAFAYWKEGDVIVSYSADYTFIVEGDRTLEAYFGMNMPVNMANLVVDGDAMTITGSNDMEGVAVSLKLDSYDSDMEMWSVDATNSTLEWRSPMDGTPLNLTVLYGEVWLDMDAFSMAMAKVVADFGGELCVFNLEMTAATETLEVGVATELSLEFGALVMRGTWYDENDVEYPFEAQVGGFDYTKAEQECMTTVSLGNFDDDTNWLGMAQGLMTVTVADGTVELTGTVTTMSPINTLNIVAQGMIEILDLNLDATVEEMGGYLHLTAVDDEASGMDFDLYLNDYTGADGEYELNEMSTVAGGAAAATGSLTKSGNTYTGTVYAAAGTLYVFDLTLTEFVPEYENIVITGLSGAAEARYMGWGDEYYLALSLEGTWSDGVEYPVLLEITDGYDAAATSGTVAVSLTIGGWEETDPWLGNAEGELSYTLSGKNITLKGKMENPYAWPAAVYWDVNITGTILPNYTRNVTAGNFGTICLPYGGEVKGATLYECVKAESDGVLLGSVNKLEAGVPYIFKATATATQIAVYCDATVADEAGASNGLHGTFEDETAVGAGNYIVYENELCEVVSDVKVNANRAYLVMSEVPTSHTQMPGRRYIGMGVHGENGTTGLDNIMTTDAPVKAIENGQLIIIRGGEKFNAQGQKL